MPINININCNIERIGTDRWIIIGTVWKRSSATDRSFGSDSSFGKVYAQTATKLMKDAFNFFSETLTTHSLWSKFVGDSSNNGQKYNIIETEQAIIVQYQYQYKIKTIEEKWEKGIICLMYAYYEASLWKLFSINSLWQVNKASFSTTLNALLCSSRDAWS